MGVTNEVTMLVWRLSRTPELSEARMRAAKEPWPDSVWWDSKTNRTSRSPSSSIVHRSIPPLGSVPGTVQLVPARRIHDTVSQADYVSMAATHQTGNPPLLNAELISALRPDCVVINVARGGAIDNDACLAALEAGALGGLGLDVFPVEPYPADGPLLTHPRVLATAHTAALTDGYFAAASQRLSNAISDYSAGLPISNALVSPLISIQV
jgi:phosphoglycerate dehydrogenase-like enzyme